MIAGILVTDPSLNRITLLVPLIDAGLRGNLVDLNPVEDCFSNLRQSSYNFTN